MAERPVDIDISNSWIKPPTPEEAARHMAKQVEILDRGSLHSRFKIPDGVVPEHLHYEWAPLNSWSVSRMTSKGFVRGDQYAEKSEFLNRDASGNPCIGDVYLWVIPKVFKENLDRIEKHKEARAQDPRLAVTTFAQQMIDGQFLSLPEDKAGVNEAYVADGHAVVAAIKEAQLDAREAALSSTS